MIEQFKNYVENFDIKNNDIKAKYNHSLRVMKLNEEYAKRLNFSKEDIEIAKIIGLLHDYGRFIQIKKYHTMQDKKIDHADYGVKLLFEDKEIEKFNIPKNYYDIIEFAIKNHNKLKSDWQILKNELEGIGVKIPVETDKKINELISAKYDEINAKTLKYTKN